MHHLIHAPSHRTASTSLLVWGGAPGSSSNASDDDLDIPIFSFSSQGDDEPDPDEHADL